MSQINVAQIYHQFCIPHTLQKHMLRVAAMAKIITTNWTGPIIDKESIVEGCLFHDIAKPMTFDLSKQAHYGTSEEEIARLVELQVLLKTNYGENEHQATVKICAEIGLSENAVRVVDNLEWLYSIRLMREQDFMPLIAIYSDMRIGPAGALSLKNRLEDLKQRTGENHDEYAYKLEEFLNQYVSIKLEDITTEMVENQVKRVEPFYYI